MGPISKMGRATSNTEQFEGCNDYGNNKIERCQDVIKANLGIAPLSINTRIGIVVGLHEHSISLLRALCFKHKHSIAFL